MKYSIAKIMIVEEDINVALSIKSIFKKYGHDVLKIVDTGEEAIETACKIKPDIVLMNINIKGKINSFQAGRILTKEGMPVIFIKTRDGTGLLKHFDMPDKNYVMKSYEKVILENKIELILEN